MHAREEKWAKIQTKKNKNLTQIYKNMPLDSYQQLRPMGALFTEKGNIPLSTTIKTSFTYGHEAYLHLVSVTVMIGFYDSEEKIFLF